MHIDRFYMLIKTKPILVFQVLTKFSSLNFSFLVNKEAKHYFTMSVIFILKSRNFALLQKKLLSPNFDFLKLIGTSLI